MLLHRVLGSKIIFKVAGSKMTDSSNTLARCVNYKMQTDAQEVPLRDKVVHGARQCGGVARVKDGRGGKRLKATELTGGAAVDAWRRAAACEIWHS